ncbi:MAG TPA: isochorismatase family cysteine hydrolase [Armatimonadota bacterium]|jgi:ureidoacrylate peracid hydrolase
MPGLADFKEEYVTAETLDRELETWMAEVAPFQWRPVAPLNPAATALVIVDMTKPFAEEGYPLVAPSAPAIVPRLAEAVAAFRRAGRPVLWLVQGHHSLPHDRGAHLARWWPTMICEGTPDVEMTAGLEPLPEEKIIYKRRYSGFYQTDLELTLRCLGASQVVIAGVLTNVCPFSTAVDAFMRDLDVYYLADGTAAHSRALHVSALQNIAGWSGAVVRTKEVCAWVEGR